MMFNMGTCIDYLQVQSDIVQLDKNITALEKNIATLAKENDAVEAVLENEVSNQLQQLETRIGMLATLVSLSPFLGLFGTVWGVMMAFCGIAVAGKSDFTALAPGVAGALLTTVAGLVVAIPSLVGYNLLGGTLRQLTIIMDNFTEQFMVTLKLSQLKLAKKNTSENNQEDNLI